MAENLDLIEYRQGMFKKGLSPDDFPVKIWRGDEIPAGVRTAIKTEGLMKLRGVYGNRKSGDPIEYDHLKLVLGNKTVEITVFNRGITLFISNDEKNTTNPSGLMLT